MAVVKFIAQRHGKEAIPIDEENLDKEWLAIAEQIFNAAEAVSEAEGEYLAAKAKLEERKTTTSSDVRESPKDYGLKKVTEAAIIQKVNGHPRVQKANDACLSARAKHERAKNVVTGLMEKRRAMENYVRLFEIKWFAEPRDKTGAASDMRKSKKFDRRGDD
jgi:hypothetical protein